jgi:hypothetical protein
MQLNTKKHTLDLMRFVASAIKAYLDIDIINELISLSDDDLMEVVEFANDAVLESRRQIMSQVMTDHWANPNSNIVKASKKGWLVDGTIRKANEKGWLVGGTIRIASEERLKKGCLEGGTIRKAHEKGWLEGGTIRKAHEKGWLEGGTIRKAREKGWLEGGTIREARNIQKACMHCKEFFYVNLIRRHQEACLCSPVIQQKFLGHHQQQQEHFCKYTPSQNDVILQTDSQRRNKESYPKLNGNVIFEESIRTHSVSLKKYRKRSLERTAYIDKIIKTIEERGYFGRYFKLKKGKYVPISQKNNNAAIIREMNVCLTGLGLLSR